MNFPVIDFQFGQFHDVGGIKDYHLITPYAVKSNSVNDFVGMFQYNPSLLSSKEANLFVNRFVQSLKTTKLNMKLIDSLQNLENVK